jgi:hypothetical protein
VPSDRVLVGRSRVLPSPACWMMQNNVVQCGGVLRTTEFAPAGSAEELTDMTALRPRYRPGKDTVVLLAVCPSVAIQQYGSLGSCTKP